jgi:hypothetical protein
MVDLVSKRPRRRGSRIADEEEERVIQVVGDLQVVDLMGGAVKRREELSFALE